MKTTTSTIAILASLLFVASAARAAEKPALPPNEQQAKERLEQSPRHGEWVDIQVPDQQRKVRAYVVYPERKDNAPVVIVIQEIFGLTDWIRSVADQLAAEGFIAIAPDLLSGMGPNGGGTEAFASRDEVTRAVRGLKNDDVKAMLDATREYGIKLESANGKSATIGFCWGGGTSFRYATQQPALNAAVVYYGTSPDSGYDKVNAAVFGNYGENDQRVNATIDRAKAEMKQAGKEYTANIYPGAGHGFLRQQGGQNGANQKATEAAWPATVKFLKEHTK